MPLIKAMSDLRNHTNEISILCHRENEPVFITKNGQGDMVVMSQACYEHLHSLLELYQKLGDAEALAKAGEKGITHTKMMKRLRTIVA